MSIYELPNPYIYVNDKLFIPIYSGDIFVGKAAYYQYYPGTKDQNPNPPCLVRLAVHPFGLTA